MAIFYSKGNIISRSSGRSAVAALAYRRSEKMQSLAHAAYQRGEQIEGDVIIHDYTRKSGVMYSEIMLPENAPPEFMDSETLWNAVETSEKRKDAQLAREIIVALQREFNLEEQREVLRDYVEENFVSKGMIVDFSIHDKGDGNPHAHIMLTMREVTPEGFGKKNREWNNRKNIVDWRESWADVNNRMFVRKGLDERIDHRSYKEQGLDREPMIHLGYEAWALEKKGIKTDRGNHNREVQRRNAEREARKETAQPEAEKAAQHLEKLEDKKPAQAMQTVEKQLNDEKTNQIVEKRTARHEEHQTIALYMQELQEDYITLESERQVLNFEHHKAEAEILKLYRLSENMEKQAESMAVLQNKAVELQENHQKLHRWNWIKKAEIEKEIAQATEELKQTQMIFKNLFRVDPNDATMAIKYIQEKIRVKKREVSEKTVRISAISDNMNAIKLAYHTQKLINETRPDRLQLELLLEKMNKLSEPDCEKLNLEQINHRFNTTISEANYQNVINNLSYEQAKILLKKKAQDKTKEKPYTQEYSPTIGRWR
jgi:hypothetical protein